MGVIAKPTRRALLPALAALAAAAAMVAGPADAAAAEPFVLLPDRSYDTGSPPPDPAHNRLDLYLPRAPSATAPIVVYVHGGSWRAGDKANRILDKARLFTSRGYAFASLNYRLSPDPPDLGAATRIRFPAHPHDLGEAIGWLRRNTPALGGDASRMFLIGHSAGAHLVSLIGTDPRFLRAYGTSPSAIRGVVALDTAGFDITARADPRISPLGAGGLVGLWNAFGTGAENAADGSWAAASPVFHADRRDPPHLLVTQATSPRRIAANTEMAEALGHDAGSVVTVPLDHAGINAALGDPADATAETDAVVAFVREALTTDAAPRTRLDRRPPKRPRLRGKRKRRVGFRFSAADPRARFNCRIDGRAWRKCASPERYRLGRGRHRFRVRSTTRDGKGPVRRFAFRILR